MTRVVHFEPMVDEANSFHTAMVEQARKTRLRTATTTRAILANLSALDGTVALPACPHPYSTLPDLMLRHPDKQFMVDFEGIRYARITKP